MDDLELDVSTAFSPDSGAHKPEGEELPTAKPESVRIEIRGQEIS